MINYELAKELKDAGYPYGGNYCSQCEGTLVFHPEDDELSEYAPTLSELIDACLKLGARFEVNCTRTRHAIWMKGKQVTDVCKTPEEAVAKLYLELNKKDGN